MRLSCAGRWNSLVRAESMAPSDLRFAFYGDDFTGATDTLATLASAGLKTLLFMGPPTSRQLAAAGRLDCLGIAGAARSMPNIEQEAELDRVGRFFATLDAPVIHYKTCSTFDSSPDIGSIGVAVRSLRRQLGVSSFTAFVGGQPSLGRYCVFGNLFAAFESGGAVYRLDRHPTMSHHPVTPMHEADLRLHLAQQGLARLGLIPYPDYGLSQEAFDHMLARELADYPDGLLFDVAHAGHLAAIGEVIWRYALQHRLLAVGPSSVAQALIAHWRSSQISRSVMAVDSALDEPDWTQSGPFLAPSEREAVFVFSGSRSPLTAGQIQAADSYQHFPVSPRLLMADESAEYQAALRQVTEYLQRGIHTLVFVTDDGMPLQVSAAALAQACAGFVARVMATAKPRRVGVAGGDTSSYAVQALSAWGLSYLGRLDSGVAMCRMHSDDAELDGVEIMLKGGQMGATDVFEKLLQAP